MILFFLLALLDIYIVCSMRTAAPAIAPTPVPVAEAVGSEKGGNGKYIIYGTMGCGWTRKQVDVMKEKNLPYEFVDCPNGGACPPDVKAFPTIKHPDGKVTVGFNNL